MRRNSYRALCRRARRPRPSPAGGAKFQKSRVERCGFLRFRNPKLPFPDFRLNTYTFRTNRQNLMFHWLLFATQSRIITGSELFTLIIMTEYFLLLVGTVLVNNFVLVKFLGLCPFMGVSKKLETAIGMGLATTFVLTLASVCAYLVETYVLVPLGIQYLRTMSFILVIAVVVQFTEMVVHKTSPTLYRLLGIFLPLITTNCAVLGVALLNINENHNFIESIIYGFGAAVGFSLVLILFASMRERIAAADVPAPFKGASIAMITAGLMSLAFMGFTGLVKL
ncbi:electron transport complex subunit RsxA [Vibrio mediterranei]|nr:electron transport complex subunit RsxA [Vibrio mediterranei]